MSAKTAIGGTLTALGLGFGAPLALLAGIPTMAMGASEDAAEAKRDKNKIIENPPDQERLERQKALARSQAGLSRTILSGQARGSTGAAGNTSAGGTTAQKGTTLG